METKTKNKTKTSSCAMNVLRKRTVWFRSRLFGFIQPISYASIVNTPNFRKRMLNKDLFSIW